VLGLFAMKRTPAETYLEKAAKLSRDEAEQFFSRMDKKLIRKLDEHKLIPVEVLAIQLEIEDERLKEWRERFAEIKARSKEG
jgi:hypothetical protein